MPMSHKVFAIVSLYDQPELLPHFLSHYTKLGVHRILVVVRTNERDRFFVQAEGDAGQFPASVHWFPSDKFADNDKSDVEQSVLCKNGVQSDDYVMHLDLDEFQEYPAPLAEIVRLMNLRDDWALRGWIVDRVAEDGGLPPIRPTPSIGEQFPIGCAATEVVLGAWTQKIVLCRGRVRLQGGVRHDTCNAYYHDVPMGHPHQYVVHHFKWIDGLAERLQARLETAAIGPAYAQECRRFIAYWKEHGRFDLAAPPLRARWLGGLNYPRAVFETPASNLLSP
jgi:hypothetical protein